MSGGLLNVGVRALITNQAVLQTTGNNIANVNTPGYSRQTVGLSNAAGQYFGGGYIGKGVEITTITRAYDQFLTRQSSLASAVSSSDTARADKLKQLENLFPGGTSGLGAAINNMLNSFSDVASAPTDMTARSVALTSIDETAKRMNSISGNLDDMQLNLTQELNTKIDAVNKLAEKVAAVNEQIARAKGNGQPPNDLLDQRDQLIRELNQYVQTTSIEATDGTLSIFIGGSQPLILGTKAASLALGKDTFGDPLSAKLTISRSGQTTVMDENTLGGGEIPSLLRFQNTDMTEARNLLGRMTLAITTTMNDQHKLGLDLDGNAGGNLFTPAVFGVNNILQPAAPAPLNTGTAVLSLSVTDVTHMVASDYEVNFTAATTGNIVRRSDGHITNFDLTLPPVTIDGLTLDVSAGAANAGDRFLLKPYSTVAGLVGTEFSTPRALAVASPVAGLMGTSNTGSLQLSSLSARSNPPTNVPVTITFTGTNSYTRSDDAVNTYTYVSGTAIEASLPNNYPTTPYTYTSLTDWSLTLKGSPKAGDSFTVEAQPAAFRNLNAGNATAMMGLRDVAMFDGAALTDGYASLMAQIGIRAQSANYSAEVSSNIATNLEKDRAGVAAVNLDEEAAKLLQYQQAYQASAKMIQIANGIFDTLIQSLR